MRFLARFGLGLCGLALLASPARPCAGRSAADRLSSPATAADGQAAGHHHKGLFGWRHCVECQRAMAKKRDGVDVPPPPSMMPAGVMAGQVVHVQGDPAAAPPARQELS